MWAILNLVSYFSPVQLFFGHVFFIDFYILISLFFFNYYYLFYWHLPLFDLRSHKILLASGVVASSIRLSSVRLL